MSSTWLNGRFACLPNAGRGLSALLLLLLATGCGREMLRPERLDEAAMRAWLERNYSPGAGVEISWRGQYEDAERRVPFRLEVLWTLDSSRISLKSPFGGELARLRCRPGADLGLQSGSALPDWLNRAARAVDNPALRGLLESGADLLERRPRGLDLEILDPALYPLLALAGSRLPPGLLEAGFCEREALGPWLWGEWRPPAWASWQPSSRSFAAGDSSWTVHQDSGMPDRAQVAGWVMRLDQYEKQDGLWRPGRLRLTREDRQLVLQCRSWRRIPLDKE